MTFSFSKPTPAFTTAVGSLTSSSKGKSRIAALTDTDLPAEDDLVKTALYDGAVRAAGFLAGHHAVFVVSQLADNENVAIANAVATAIRTHIENRSLRSGGSISGNAKTARKKTSARDPLDALDQFSAPDDDDLERNADLLGKSGLLTLDRPL